MRRASPAAPVSAAAVERPLLVLQPPSHQNGADRKASAHRSQEKQIAFLQPLLLNRIVQRERDGAARGVAEAFDIDDDFFLRDAELFRGGQNDSAVGLMGNEEVDFARP